MSNPYAGITKNGEAPIVTLHDHLQASSACDHRTGQLLGVPYPVLLSYLGSPNVKDDPYKVDASWLFTIEMDGEIFPCSIWNYKNGPAYNGEGDIADIDVWSFGGRAAAMEALNVLLWGKTEPTTDDELLIHQLG